jgi:type IV pilus assembly protein PilC
MSEVRSTWTSDRVSKALAHVELLKDDLIALQRDGCSKENERLIQSFLESLQSGSEAMVNEASHARWLPAILEFEQTVTDRCKRQQMLSEAIRRNTKVRYARSYTLVYLCVVALAVFLFFVFLCTAILPVFSTMYKEFRMKLPPLTEFVLWLGSKIGPNSRLIVAITSASLIMIYLGRRISDRLAQDRVRASYWQRLAFGNSENLIGMSRFAHSLACLLRIQIPIAQAILIAGRSSDNLVLLRSAVRLSTELKTKTPRQCRSSRNFPPLVIEAISNDGETNGGYDRAASMLLAISQIYWERAKHRREWMADFLLPIAILFLGCTAGILVLALFLPLVSLMTSLS